MLVIGLTGGIACGKSTVSNILKDLGASHIDADRLVHDLQMPGESLYRAIVSEFGEDILRDDKTIDRALLGEIVFTDRKRLRRLEELTHPLVVAETDRRLDALRREEIATGANEPTVCVIEAIKLIESKLRTRCDVIWIVLCDEKSQRERLRGRGLSEEAISARLRSGPDFLIYRGLAQLLIDNSSSLAELQSQVEGAYRSIVQRAIQTTHESENAASGREERTN